MLGWRLVGWPLTLRGHLFSHPLREHQQLLESTKVSWYNTEPIENTKIYGTLRNYRLMPWRKCQLGGRYAIAMHCSYMEAHATF